MVTQLTGAELRLDSGSLSAEPVLLISVPDGLS